MMMSLVSDGFSMDGTAAGADRTASEESCPAEEVSRIELMSHSNAHLPAGKADAVYRTRSTASRPNSGDMVRDR
jgi:hypothetical protein